jgi:hypothetical protein
LALQFDSTRRTDGDWRITWNPLAWGTTLPEVIVLGFSKGPTQAGALATAPHDTIAYRGARTAVGKILTHVGLMSRDERIDIARQVDALISDRQGRFHFGSLIRCSVERRKPRTGEWEGTGGSMLDKFLATQFGLGVATRCTKRFLGSLPTSVRLIVAFGLGTNGNYVGECKKLFSIIRPGDWRWDEEDVSYTDGAVTVVHVEHFRSQGPLIPQWLGERDHSRQVLGQRARAAVARALRGERKTP